jgi:hypothetical protein
MGHHSGQGNLAASVDVTLISKTRTTSGVWRNLTGVVQPSEGGNMAAGKKRKTTELRIASDTNPCGTMANTRFFGKRSPISYANHNSTVT